MNIWFCVENCIYRKMPEIKVCFKKLCVSEHLRVQWFMVYWISRNDICETNSSLIQLNVELWMFNITTESKLQYTQKVECHKKHFVNFYL